MSGSILNVLNKSVYEDDTIIRYDFHTHTPYASTTFNNNDEIRIPIHQQDIYTLPSESFLYIKGELVGANNAADNTIQMVSNGVGHLFDEIRYEICGTEVDRVKNVGLTSIMKNLLTFKPQEKNILTTAGCNENLLDNLTVNKDFSCCVPLKMMLGFMEDYKKIILNVKQELVLIRSSTNDNAIYMTASTTKDYKLTLTHISLKIPYIHVSDKKRLDLLEIVRNDIPIPIPFRRWELNEYPSAPKTKQLIWTIKSTAQLEKPRYVIVAFQTNRKNNKYSSLSNFDFCSMRNIKLYLNSEYYPYDNINGDAVLLHMLYTRFQSSYYYGSNNEPIMDVTSFLAKAPLYVIDCSKQSENLKTGSVDVRLEIETTEDIPDKTTINCLIIYDTVLEYTPLSGTVRKSLV